MPLGKNPLALRKTAILDVDKQKSNLGDPIIRSSEIHIPEANCQLT